VSDDQSSARHAANRHLARRFYGIVAPFDDPEVAELEQRAGLDAVETFEGIGLLTPREAAGWRTRFQRAQSLDPVRDEAVRAQAEAYLERELDKLRGGASEAEFERFEDALDVFAELGVLTVRERIAWYKRAAEWDPSADDEDGDEAEGRRAEAALAFSGSEIARVVPGPDQRASGLRVTAVIVFEDGVRFEWHLVGDLAMEGHGEGVAAAWEHAPYSTGEPLEITDDVGTPYSPAGDGRAWSDGQPPAAFGDTTFVPAVPAQARRLTVKVEYETLDVPL
jgi:hypothetical protein